MSQLKLDCNTDEMYWTDANTDDSVWLPAAYRYTIASPCIATMHLHYIAIICPSKQDILHQKSQTMMRLPNRGAMIFYIVFNQSMHCIVSTRARLVKMSPPFLNLSRHSIKPLHLGPIKIRSKSGNALKCSCIKLSHGGNTWLSRFPLKHSTTVDFNAVHVAFHSSLSINIALFAVFCHCNIL